MIRILTASLGSFVCIACHTAPGPVVPESRVERQMIGLLEKFDRWDYNGDGHLNVNELREVEKISSHKAADVLAFYDTNGDKKVSLREAQAGFARVEEAERRAAAR